MQDFDEAIAKVAHQMPPKVPLTDRNYLFIKQFREIKKIVEEHHIPLTTDDAEPSQHFVFQNNHVD